MDDFIAATPVNPPLAGSFDKLLREIQPRQGSWRQPGVAQERLYDSNRTVELPGSEIYFPLIANGLDYLVSVVEHLQTGSDRVSARDLKYAVLHLAAGSEVLLKARLQREYWALVFTDPAKAKRSQLEDGSLNSCTPAQAIQRLRDFAQVGISVQQATALEELAKVRNKLQHYGLTGTDAKALAVESKAAEVLDFLVAFLDEELLPELDEPERESTRTDMERVRSGLTGIQGFVKKRRQRLRSVLDAHRDHTLECPGCHQWALIARPADADRDPVVLCLFCGRTGGPAPGPWYGVELLGRDPDFYPDQYGRRAAERCPVCGEEDLVQGANTAAAPDTPIDFCFSCATVVPGIQKCGRCGRLYQQQDGMETCAACPAHIS
ncbi:hypothetical protein [Streptomyces sp. NPDC001450]